jgi:hypothetical protein
MTVRLGFNGIRAMGSRPEPNLAGTWPLMKILQRRLSMPSTGMAASALVDS